MGDDTYGYAYDPIGSRIVTTENAETTEYVANGLNPYTAISNQQSAVSNPAYDWDGNLTFLPSTSGGGTGGEGWYFQWDAENRLILASNATTLVRNTYDSRSRRIRKEVAAWDEQVAAYVPQSASHYLWDGWNVFREVRDQMSEVSTNYYTWGNDLSGSLQGAGGVGGLLAVSTVSTADPQPVIHFPNFDANGNVTEYVATNGTVAARYAYDAFGATVAQSGDMAESFTHRFSTKYLDTETGLYDYGRRFYDPIWGRWLSRDPVAERGGANLYGFCRNNPVKYFDTLGNTPLDVRAARIRAYLEAGAEDMAADEALLLYRNIAWGGEFVEPLAASLMKNWLDGAPEDPFTIPSRHVKRAVLYDEPPGTSPKDQLASQLCALVPNLTSRASGSLSGSALNLRATQGVYYHAFGGFKITFTGTYDCNRSARCKFKGNWEFYDKYDWHDGLDATVTGTTIPDAWALLVEEYHGAKPFEEDGNWRGTVKVNCPCTTASSPGGR